MRKIVFLIIIALGIFIDAQAQSISTREKTDGRAAFRVNYPDSSQKSFFNKHTQFNYIVVSYKSDTALTLNICTQSNKWPPNERYELTFEGDRYLLAKKYPTLSVPKPPKMKMQYFEGIPKGSRTGYRLTSTAYRDSISHHFSFYTVTNNDVRPSKGLPYRAEFKGDFSALQKKIELNFKKWGTVTDSVLIITGVVERDGSFGNLELKAGNATQFSKKVMEFIGQEATSWSPAWQNARTVKYLVKFFIRFNASGSVTLSVL